MVLSPALGMPGSPRSGLLRPLRLLRSLHPQLPARRVDVEAPAPAHRRLDALVPEPGGEGPDPLRRSWA